MCFRVLGVRGFRILGFSFFWFSGLGVLGFRVYWVLGFRVSGFEGLGPEFEGWFHCHGVWCLWLGQL